MFDTWICWIMKKFDYINRVIETLPLSVYEGTWTHSPLSLLCITMILRVRRKFFEITTFPNIDCPPAASSCGRALPRPAPDSASVQRLPQYERSQLAAMPAYSHRHIRLDSCENYLILCSAFLSEHQTEYQGLLSIL